MEGVEERELGTVEGYVFQQYSMANSRTTLWKKAVFDDVYDSKV